MKREKRNDLGNPEKHITQDSLRIRERMKRQNKSKNRNPRGELMSISLMQGPW